MRDTTISICNTTLLREWASDTCRQTNPPHLFAAKLLNLTEPSKFYQTVFFSFYRLYDYSLQVVHEQVEQNATAVTFNIKNPPDVNIRGLHEPFFLDLINENTYRREKNTACRFIFIKKLFTFAMKLQVRPFSSLRKS